jgi:class 3 adenylate cyclase
LPLPVGGVSSGESGQDGVKSWKNKLGRTSIPGVFIHATAVNNLLRGDELRPLAPAWRSCLAGGLVAMIATATMLLPVAGAAAVLGGSAALLTGVSLFLFRQHFIAPLLATALWGGLGFIVALGYRFVLFDRQKWRIRRLFALYTSPAFLDQLLKSDRLPELGGEERQVTVWFSDLAGFTALSEGMTPVAVVAMMNRYLTAITEVIEQYGGFVDKYIGDAVVAVFGAPRTDPEHPANAVLAAVAVHAKLAQLHKEGCFGRHSPQTRIGICSGNAMVGNIGSRQRFNYTVMGDTVNLASRLEGANKYLGTDILLAGATARLLPKEMVVREVDRVRAKGRQGSLSVFEPVALSHDSLTEEQGAQLARYADALAMLRRGEPEQAVLLLADLADIDPVAASLRQRAEAQRQNGELYQEGVLVLGEK